MTQFRNIKRVEECTPEALVWDDEPAQQVVEWLNRVTNEEHVSAIKAEGADVVTWGRWTRITRGMVITMDGECDVEFHDGMESFRREWRLA